MKLRKYSKLESAHRLVASCCYGSVAEINPFISQSLLFELVAGVALRNPIGLCGGSAQTQCRLVWSWSEKEEKWGRRLRAFR